MGRGGGCSTVSELGTRDNLCDNHDNAIKGGFSVEVGKAKKLSLVAFFIYVVLLSHCRCDISANTRYVEF